MTVAAAKVIETEDWEDDPASTDNEEISEDIIQEDGSSATFNAGWADCISRLLKSSKLRRKKTLVLSRAKKLSDVKIQKTKPAGFQVATTDGKVKEEKIVVEAEEVEQEPPRKKRKELPNLRVKPNILDKDRERTLTKIATKGVVQLFNAVKMQQKDIDKKLKEAGPLEVKKEKVLKSIDKREFLDVLMGEKSVPIDTKVQTKQEDHNSGKDTWNVLREDFMMGARLKDWDKELENVKETESEQDIESE